MQPGNPSDLSPKQSPTPDTCSPSSSRSKEMDRSCYRSIWKREPMSTLAPWTKSSHWCKQKRFCPQGLVTTVTSRPRSSELHRTLVTLACTRTGPSLKPGELTFPRKGWWGRWGRSWAPDPLPSPAWSQGRKDHFQ